MYEKLADVAARSLDDEFRGQSWYLSTGVGETEDGAFLVVYTNSSRNPAHKIFKDGWQGFHVVVQSMGRVRALARETA